MMILYEGVQSTQMITGDFDHTILVVHTQCLFSIIESRFRIFTQKLDSRSCAEDTVKFYKIRDLLLDRLNKKDRYKDIIVFPN
jgi:hypothetical protein